MNVLLIAVIVVLGFAGYAGYKIYRKQIEDLNRLSEQARKLDRELSKLWNYEHFIEVNATENYFPKEG